jgi:hypothetical protein
MNLDASRGFGFITFPTLGDATSFMDQHGPTIMLQYSVNGAQYRSPVDLDYSRDNNNLSKNDWECPVCNHRRAGFQNGVNLAGILCGSQDVRAPFDL